MFDRLRRWAQTRERGRTFNLDCERHMEEVMAKAPKPGAEVTADGADNPAACRVATGIFTYLTSTKRPLLAKIAGMVAAYRPEIAEPNAVVTELRAAYAEGGARLAKALDVAAALIERLSSRCEALLLQIEEANIGRNSLRAELRDVQRNYAAAEARCAALEAALREAQNDLCEWCRDGVPMMGPEQPGHKVNHMLRIPGSGGVAKACKAIKIKAVLTPQSPERPAATAEEGQCLNLLCENGWVAHPGGGEPMPCPECNEEGQ